MKKLTLIILTLVVMISAGFAQSGEKLGIRPMNWKPAGQFQTRSVAVNTSTDKISVLWLRDGLANNYTAVSYPIFQVTGLGNRVNIVALGAFDSNLNKSNIYTGTGVSVDLVSTGGWNVKMYAGYKGFNLGKNFAAADGKSAWVFGAGISIPIR